MNSIQLCKNCGATIVPMTLGNALTSFVVMSCPKGCGVLAWGNDSLFDHVSRARTEIGQGLGDVLSAARAVLDCEHEATCVDPKPDAVSKFYNALLDLRAAVQRFDKGNG